MNRVVDAVICDPILGKVVRPDLGRAVAGANLGPPLPRPRGLLLGEDAVKQPSPQDLECLYLVLELGLLVLALNHEIGREVGDPHRAVRGVDALATRARGAEHIDPQVLLLDLDVDLLRLGEHRHRGGGGVDPALRFGHRHALHAMHA